MAIMNPTPIAGTPFDDGVTRPPVQTLPTAPKPAPVPMAPPTVPLAGAPSRVPGPANPLLKVPTQASDARGGQVSPARSPASPPISGPPAPTPVAPIPLATSSVATPYANMQTNVPGSATDYTNKTIAPGPGVDRLALAKSNFQNFKDANEGGYKADLRDASTAAAGRGQIGSGMLRGRLGDIATVHDQTNRLAESSFLNDATSGSIDDAYKNIGIAQQQQGFQSGQQQTAFDQAQRTQAMQEALKNGDFQRYYQLLQAGNAGSPADIQLALAGQYGGQASAAGQSAGVLASNATRPYQLPLAS